MDEHRFTAMSEFRARFFPNMVEEEQQHEQTIVILPRPGV